MTRNKPAAILSLLILIFIETGTVFAQAPNISYTSPQNYTANTTIAPLKPSNSGGPVIPGLTGPVITFAGSLKQGANNAQGIAATFYGPYGVAADQAGNIYVADAFNNMVRKIDPFGQVTTLAGSGAMGSQDGAGANASFNYPNGIALDAAGNIYVGDTYNNLIRKITPTGLVTTLAGSGKVGAINGMGNAASFKLPTGLTVDGAGNLYVADQSNNLIRKVTPAGLVTTFAGSGAFGDADGTGTGASFQNPTGITIDASGNFYVADDPNQLIRKITPAGVVTTIAGSFGVNGSADGPGSVATFNFPFGIVADASGNLYIADQENNEIRKIDQNGNVTTFAGTKATGHQDGTALAATFHQLTAVTIDKKGNIFIADRANNEIREIVITGYTIDKTLPAGLTFDSTTGIISGTPTAPSPAVNYTVTAYNISGSSSTVVNIAVNSATLVAPPDISYQTPQTYTVNTIIAPLAPKNAGGAVPAAIYGQVSTIAGSGIAGSNDGQGSVASFNTPRGITIDGLGNLYVADDNNNLIRKITPAGLVSTFAGNGLPNTIDGIGTSASFNHPAFIITDASGNLYETEANVVRKISQTGIVTTIAGNANPGSANGIGTAATFNLPLGLDMDASGNIYIADLQNNLIRKITPSGLVSTFAGSGVAGATDGIGTAASFYRPVGIAVDAVGNVFVGDDGNSLIRKITPGGVVTTLAGNGLLGFADGKGNLASFKAIFGLATAENGYIYVADANNNMIRSVDNNGLVSTIAGGDYPFGFADGIGAKASFDDPYGIVSDKAGYIYITDSAFDLIRKIAIYGYTIDKILPSGLTFDPTTGIISGTPTAVSPATNYTVTAYNAGGSSSTIVNIAVTGNIVTVIPPPNISYNTPQIYQINAAISPLAPKNTGSAVPATIYGQVSTFAGTGTQGSADGQGTAASFSAPTGTGVDMAGNLYIADNNGTIRKITPSGNVTTLAGHVWSGPAIDGTGAAARFNAPSGVAADAAGNLYVADSNNNLVRKVTPAGVATTFAGSGLLGTSDGPANTASFNSPVGVAVDVADNVYVVDQGGLTIRKITAAGIVSTLAGTSSAIGSNDGTGTAATFNFPYDIAIDGNGNLFVTDRLNNLVRKITPGGVVTTIAGNTAGGSNDGVGTAAGFLGLQGIVVDGTGNIYVADTQNQLIRRINPAGVVVTIAGIAGKQGFTNGIGKLATFNYPSGLAIDQNANLYVADDNNAAIRKITISGYTIDKPLPAGLTFDPATGIITGTPTALSAATDYTVTAYNAGGSSSTILNITIIDEQTVTFGPLPSKTVCDADFDPGATGNGPITYTSTNTAVATIVAGKIHIAGAGTTAISASDGTSQAVQTLTVTAALVPSITISPSSQDNCAGAVVTYTAMPINGGTSPSYQWQVNGQNAGTNGPQFTSSNLNNNDQVTCTLTSNAVCTTSATATSNAAAFILDQPVTTSVAILSTATGPVCSGTPVTFIATPVTTDNNPVYQWQVNGVNTGSNSPVFTSTNLGDGDMVTCVLNSAGKCLVNPAATSNPITITLSPASACIIVIPNTFTPNGDGVNDLWNITELQSYPGCTVSIFNRYGTLVYNSVGYPKPWDGNFNGKSLPVGTYYYIIDLKNGKNKMAGSVTIVR